jgi:tetratricopeptide (TPR) repeat protein
MMGRLSVTMTGLAVAMALLAQDGFAQDETFNRLVQDGMNHYRNREYDEAVQKFEAAYAINQQPELIYNVARAHEKAPRRDQAIQAYERFLSLPGSTADLRAKALASVEALRREKEAMERSRQPRDTGGGSVVPPGSGGGVVTRPPKETSRTLEWVLIGGGAAVAATGAIFGVLALQANSDFKTLKADGADRATLEDKKSTVDNNALVADVMIGVGAVSIIAGAIMYLTTGHDDGDVAVGPVFGPDQAGLAVSGRF